MTPNKSGGAGSDADGKLTGGFGEALQKAFPWFADDLAWWTDAARAERARRPPPY